MSTFIKTMFRWNTDMFYVCHPILFAHIVQFCAYFVAFRFVV